MLLSSEQMGFQKFTKVGWVSLLYSTGSGDPGRMVNTGNPFLQNSYVQCFGSVLDAFSMASWNRICTQHTDPGTGTGYRYIIIYKIIEVGVKKTNHSLVMNIM